LIPLPVEDGACRVSLDVFDGPLDLLLSLVKERQLDIASDRLSVVADQYLAYVRMMDSLDVELAADYLVMAATLVFLKSKALLPPIPADFESGEESAEVIEARLRERLLVYSKYREAGEDLRNRNAEASSYYSRDAGDPSTDIMQRYRIDGAKLGAALISVLRNARPEKRTIVRERVSLMEQMEFVWRRVRNGEGTSFFELCSALDRVSIIVTFLAILELVRRNRVVFEQDLAFGDIRLLPAEVLRAS
jgi:segregation and condensation protein A